MSLLWKTMLGGCSWLHWVCVEFFLFTSNWYISNSISRVQLGFR